VFFRALLSVVFMAAAVGKLRSPLARAETARAAEVLLPVLRRLAVVATGLALALEIAAACLLVAPATATLGLALALVLLASYTAFLAVGISGGRRVVCQCFGTDGEVVGLAHLLRNALLALFAVAGLVASTGADSYASARDVVMIAAGAGAGWLFTRWDDVVYLVGGAVARSVEHPRGSR
jgi:hypothetical protein